MEMEERSLKWFRFWKKQRGEEKAPASTSSSVEASAQSEVGTPEQQRAALLELGRLLSLEDDSVVQEVAMAHDQPHDYVNKWEDRLTNRGIEQAIPALAWIALVDALAEQQLAVEIDWKQEPETVLAAVSDLLDRKGWLLPPESRGLEQAVDPQGYTFDNLIALHHVLQTHGLSLGHLDIEGDCYVLIVCRSSETAELERLARAAGYRLYGGID